jgi:hypothetical protein
VIMKNCRTFRSHHDPGLMIAWIKGGGRPIPPPRSWTRAGD